ncbi:MAG: hypothetical protein J5938_05470, partial [Clostridia bacterium]|nr:hypothetical protein [Clostridia bacterium]
QKKHLLFCTALLSLVVAASSCAGTEPERTPSSDAASGTGEPSESVAEPATEPQTEAPEPVYDIPEPEIPAQDFGGAVFRMSGWYEPIYAEQWEYPDLWAEKLTGEVVNDAVFNRNLKVEEKFNVKMEEVRTGEIFNVLMSGDDTFSMLCHNFIHLGDWVGDGILLDMNNLPYCQYDSVYWNPTMREGSEVNGHLFMMATDLTYLTLAHVQFLYFNKKILNDNDLTSPYTLVYDNQWTIENYLNLIRSISKDVNGDGIMDDKDLYGATYATGRRFGTYLQLYVGSDLHFTKDNGEGGRVIDVDMEKAQALLDALSGVFAPASPFALSTDKLEGRDVLFFMENHALFMHNTMEATSSLREMETDYGVVPNPKWDESQEEYAHRASPTCGVIAVPTNHPDTEMAGAVLEYASWLSHYTLKPAYYEVTIKTKRTRDEDAERMLDVIHDTIRFDMGDMFDTVNMANYLYNAYEGGSISRVFGSSMKKIQKSLNKLVQIMDKVAQ